MPNINAYIEYLQGLELYQRDKPYRCFFPPRDGFGLDKAWVDNLEFEIHLVDITDTRDLDSRVLLENNGFEVLSHASSVAQFDSAEAIQTA
ncbi:hypothetical protein B0O99DRAFT_679756 [Bisporella sp. PMI_857]|nr:hypothetical protein B0O99DRAFT_679756 [Bisporella sp. PMI_857]